VLIFIENDDGRDILSKHDQPPTGGLLFKKPSFRVEKGSFRVKVDKNSNNRVSTPIAKQSFSIKTIEVV
jgi:hypothetical protein